MYEAEDIMIGDSRSEPTSPTHPDMDMEVYYTIHDDGDFFIIHDRPFHQELSWVEYDIKTSTIDFIMDDGQMRNFGLPVHPQFGAKLQNTQLIAVVLMRDGKAISGEDYPLIMHTTH